MAKSEWRINDEVRMSKTRRGGTNDQGQAKTSNQQPKTNNPFHH
jgi:hypothetical protein